MNRYPLHRRPSWLIGRAADQVHIALGHESISRCHARIAFDATGVPWLRDCKSTHGVTVNKKRLPPASIGTVESNSTKPGSRGVVIHPGDVIQFGASTRIYCVEGPAEFQRGSIRLVPKPKVAPTVAKETIVEELDNSQQQEQQPEEEEDTGVGWGISMDEAGTGNDAEDVDDESVILKRQQALEDGANIPDKHRKAWEKIAALKYKLKNILLESERIEKKGDLTTGQEHQLQRNRQRSQEIQEKINERERDLYENLFPSERAFDKKSRRRQKGHGGDDDDVDDFFDRTKDSATTAGDGGDGETEASLLATWKVLRGKHRGTSVASERTRQKLLQHQKRLEYLQARGDDEAFFAQNDLDLVKEQSRKLDHDLSVIDKEMTETKRLLKIVNPKLVLKEEDATTVLSSTISSMEPPPGRKIIQEELTSTNANTSVVMPPPGEKSVSDDKGFMMPPPNKRARTVEPVLPPPDISTTHTSTSTDATSVKEATIPSPVAGSIDMASRDSFKKGGMTKGPTRPPSVAMGTLAALTAATTSSNARKRSEGGHSTSYEKSSSRQQASASTTIDLKKDEWQAPKDQDGSGKTKLNAKFAGRY